MQNFFKSSLPTGALIGDSVVPVFVYGSLMRGLGNHYLLKDGKYLGTCHTVDEYSMADLGSYPGVTFEGDEQTKVTGEVYECSKELVMGSLDALESNGSFYLRQPVSLEWTNGAREKSNYGTQHWAWMYFLMEEERYHNYPRVPSGDWLKHKAEKHSADTPEVQVPVEYKSPSIQSALTKLEV